MVPATLYDRTRRRADLDGLSLVVDAELSALFEEAYLDLWDVMIGFLDQEAPFERVEVTTTADQDYLDVALDDGDSSASIYRIVRVDFKGNGTEWVPVQRGNLASDLLDSESGAWDSSESFRYYARRGSRATAAARVSSTATYSTWRLYFDPPPDSAYTLRVWYVPPPPITYDGSSAITAFPDDFPEYAIAHVLAQIAKKEEADPAPYELERERILSRIQRFCTPHQQNAANVIPDTRSLERMKSHVWGRR